MLFGSRHDARPPRLVLRFAVYTALILATTAGAVLWFVHRDTQIRAERAVHFHAAFVADTILRDHLRASDFARPLTGTRRRELDELFRREVLVGGALRSKVYDRTGMVVYSTDHSLIGTKPAEDDAVEAIAGEPVTDVTDLNHEGGRGRDLRVLETYVPVRLAGRGRPIGAFEVYQDYRPVAQAARGAFIPISLALAFALVVLYAALFPILRRVTRSLRAQMRAIEHQALHDGLTALPNRLSFQRAVERALVAARDGGSGFAVFLLDLDRFKEINDTLGHESGDLLLREVGERLRRQIRHGDLGARLGGDEFAVIAPEVDGTATAAALAERLRAALGRPFHLRGLAIEVETSIGIAVFPEHGADVETLLRHADVAMYLAKESRSGAELYSPAKDTYSPDRLRLVGELRGALEQGQLVLHYQPQAALATGDVRRVEALLRWQHPDRGLLAADAFVPPAEHTGLVRPLTRWVLETALRQCLDWRRRGIELGVAVNITGRDLIDLGLADEVAGLLRRWRVPPHLLELEVTETTVLSDPMRARAILTRLSELGVRIAIDDFGRGNSSLGYLKRLPVDVLKIDKSFVLNMIDDQDDAVIVRSTIDLAHNLGLEVVAEGVESEAAWTRLSSLGCDTAQGYYVGRPAPAEALPTRVSGSAPRRAAASQ